MTKLNFIEVCAGAGGMSTGFVDAGFSPVLLNDFDRICCETLRNNHPNVEVNHGCMKDINFSQYKDRVDVFVGGVPCQSFSQAGKRKGIDDPRGTLIYSFIDIVKEVCPKFFVIENVEGLQSHNKGKTLKDIISTLTGIGKYKISYKVLNANDYDVPQNRKRLFIVGNLGEYDFEFPKVSENKPVLKDVLSDCPESDGIKYSELKESLFEKIPPGGCWVNLPEEDQKSYMGKSYNSGGGKRGILKRLDMNNPSLTILTSPSQKQTERCHPIYNRPLQVLESSRIQTFPDSYKFAGSRNQIYKQIGNAVPVKLAYHLAITIKKHLQ